MKYNNVSCQNTNVVDIYNRAANIPENLKWGVGGDEVEGGGEFSTLSIDFFPKFNTISYGEILDFEYIFFSSA